MEIDLHKLLERIPDIMFEAKISVLQDVARSLVYLHNLSPPVMHRILTTLFVAIQEVPHDLLEPTYVYHSKLEACTEIEMQGKYLPSLKLY